MTSTALEQKEAIEEFYRLKHEYDLKYKTQVMQLARDSTMTLAEKQERYKKMIPKCVNCKRNGGTLFIVSQTQLIASCNATPKCDLDIEIQKTPTFQAPAIVSVLHKQVEIVKSNMIEAKIIHAYGFLPESQVLDIFEFINNQYKVINEAYTQAEAFLLSITNNLEKQAEIKRLGLERYNRIQEYNELLKQYVETGQQGFLQESVEMMIDSINPLLGELRNTKYRLNKIETEEGENNTEINRLIQEPYTLKDLEYPIDANKFRDLNISDLII